MIQDCVSKAQAKVMRAAVIGAIRHRKIRQKDLSAAAKVRPQHVWDVLHDGKPMSARMHGVFKRALRRAWPALAGL